MGTWLSIPVQEDDHMPRPAYVIFSKSGAEDSVTNQISFFDVIEAVDVSLGPPSGQARPSPEELMKRQPKLRIVAAWLREEGDGPEDRFEAEIVCHAPNGDRMFSGEGPPFAFEHPFYRITVPN